MTLRQWLAKYPPDAWAVGYYDAYNGWRYRPPDDTLERAQYKTGYAEGARVKS